MLSAEVRDQGLKLSKWPQFQHQSVLMRRAADELDKRQNTIRRLRECVADLEKSQWNGKT